MKLENYCKETQVRIRKRLSDCGKEHGFQRGEKHPNYTGGIKRTCDGYVSVLANIDSPYYEMNVCGYIKRGRLVMAESLERCLESKEIVHHRNEIRDDDRIENLKLLKNHSEHATLHHGLRKLSK